jgi:hypothetical protein
MGELDGAHGRTVVRLTDDTPVPGMAMVGSERARSVEPRRMQKHEKLEGKEGNRAPSMGARARWPWRRRAKESQPWPYHGGNEGKSVRTGWRRSRRSCRQTQSTNGAAVAELNTGGPGDGVRWRALPLGLLLW